MEADPRIILMLGIVTWCQVMQVAWKIVDNIYNSRK